MNQEQYTSKQLAEQLMRKDYGSMFQFCAKDFDFRDTLEAGLIKVEKELTGKISQETFSISSYPVWSGEGEAHIYSYMRCVCSQDHFSIDVLELSYNKGHTKYDEQVLLQPTMEQIPCRSELRQYLVNFTNTPKLKQKGIKR